MKTLGIIGCGWLGYRLAHYLQSRFTIHTTVTRQAKIDDLTAAGFNPEIVNFDGSEAARWTKLDKLDAIIITVPLFSRSTDEQTLIKRSASLVHFIAGFKGLIILMSSIGVYQNKTGEVTEAFVLPSDTPGEQEICNAFPQVTILRLGGLMGDNRQLKHYKVTEPDAPVNHIHFEDVLCIVKQLLATGSTGRVYNVTAPLHPTKRAVICTQLDIAEEAFTANDGRIVSSQKLVSELNYTYLHPDPAKF